MKELHDHPQSLVSVITPTYNAVNFVSDTIDSVLSQTYQNWEMIITDDCSTDDTWCLLEKFAQKDERIKIYRLAKNGGPGLARNNSIKEASGEFIAFLDSDDLWLPQKLDKQIAFMKRRNSCLSFTSYQLISEDKKEFHKIVVAKETVDMHDMLKSNYIGCSTAMYNARELGKVYMPSIRKRQDYGLWIEIIKKVKLAHGLDERLSLYRIRQQSVSSNKFKLIAYQWRFYKKVVGLNYVMTIRSLIYWFFYSVFGIKDKGR
ncbi:teichuronic acid biosynthesis glycosyltransferase TuaG [Roseivirga pacifica]|uniref:Teichuronic acid biosynthesis glycosyltransferase TuaG n=1 Tax=Roseivirga pacifica TaxID=1267423 RepID=A0A1I0N785_9BACT|nr:glycosyltransferase family 2 protein [Roseivirga pacifica]RKQ50962.1 teichuronic acid biosynthesis glycosyltransferase TuaG [Roseivirga pacifica]SEV96729.1 teichuronic acid biosynthesis glycosyltransferase TuaG [Roseivirga pacifica]